MSNNPDKLYTAVPIPSPETLKMGQAKSATPKTPPVNLDPFVEVNVVEKFTNNAPPRRKVINWIEREPTPKPVLSTKPSIWKVREDTLHTDTLPVAEPIDHSEVDPVRARFSQMRQLHTIIDGWNRESQIFRTQGEFMADFTDDYTEVEAYAGYYPSYHKMGYAQLRTYFTWRTQVRRGRIKRTAVAYVFMYLYELINQMGVSTPQEGLDKLMTFWQAYREFDPVPEPYVVAWLKDYHAYYGTELSQSFVEFAVAHDLQKHYPEVFIYDADEALSWQLYTAISKYDITSSRFYSPEIAPVLQACFYFLIARISEACEAHGKLFADLIFRPSWDMGWRGFDRALFYDPTPPAHYQVIEISLRESYEWRGGRIRQTRTFIAEHGKKLVGYLLKEMEANLRSLLGFKHKLSANVKGCSPDALSCLQDVGIELPSFVQTAVADFYRQWTYEPVHVDMSNLGKIRAEAQETQDKLIVPEDEVSGVAKRKPTTDKTAKPTDAPPKPTPTNTLATPPEKAPAPSETGTPWQRLHTALTDIEREALRLVLAGESLAVFAKEKFIMLEVLLDAINEKAVDHVGDALLELDDTVVLYDDYLQDVKRMLTHE